MANTGIPASGDQHGPASCGRDSSSTNNVVANNAIGSPTECKNNATCSSADSLNDSQASSPEPNLHLLRTAISEVDNTLIDTLNRRAALSMAIGKVKRQDEDNVIFRPGREAEILHRLCATSKGPLPHKHLQAVYREIFSSSRALQREQRVAFLGPEGTFSHLAGRALLGSLASFHALPSLNAVFQTVENDECDIGIVPLENSLQGSVGPAFDLFLRHSVFIKAETRCRIRHSLLSREKDLASITAVYSHPQPLAQCNSWLMKNLPRASVIPMESTAAAARHVAKSCASQKGVAAIAHSDLADNLGLHVLAKGIEDNPGNWTRFVVIGATPADRAGADKSSVLFTVTDKPGSLFRVLECFANKNINMRKLESRPLMNENWKYVFFADLECDLYDERYAGALEVAAEHCLSIRVLGSYPSFRES